MHAQKSAPARQRESRRKPFGGVRVLTRSCVVAGLLLAAGAGSALADCQEDVGKLMKRRDGVIAQLNHMTSGKKKQLDPIAACPKFRSLAAILGDTVAYFEKNKEWCNIPDQVIEQAKGQRAGFTKTAGQACGIAAKIEKMKKMQAKQAQEGGPLGPQRQRLPGGPL